LWRLLLFFVFCDRYHHDAGQAPERFRNTDDYEGIRGKGVRYERPETRVETDRKSVDSRVYVQFHDRPYGPVDRHHDPDEGAQAENAELGECSEELPVDKGIPGDTKTDKGMFDEPVQYLYCRKNPRG
jgi:hypothetical protein